MSYTSAVWTETEIPRKKMFNFFYDARIIIQLFVSINRVSQVHYGDLGQENVSFCFVWVCGRAARGLLDV